MLLGEGRTMSKRDRTGEVIEIKERDSVGHGLVSYTLRNLIEQWESTAKGEKCLTDYYVIRSVTILEVFTRRQISALIDHAREYAERAVELSKHFKIDFAIVRGIQGRTITLGDIVAHSIPLNSYGQVVGYFEILMGKPFRSLLVNAVDRWRVEIQGLPSEPIIPDYDTMASHLTRLFEVRNIICHELPVSQVYTIAEVSEFLLEAERFAKAAEEVLRFEKYGLVPLTQSDMNIYSWNEFRVKDDELSNLLKAIPGDAALDAEEITCLNETQEKWLAYQKAHCEMSTLQYKGGTIRPYLMNRYALIMTENRIAELQSWLKVRLRN
jgi:uncharacterized protein YecT (DUF1311 family)